MKKVIDLNLYKNNKVLKNNNNKKISNKYIKAFKNMTDKEIKMVDKLLEN